MGPRADEHVGHIGGHEGHMGPGLVGMRVTWGPGLVSMRAQGWWVLS